MNFSQTKKIKNHYFDISTGNLTFLLKDPEDKKEIQNNSINDYFLEVNDASSNCKLSREIKVLNATNSINGIFYIVEDHDYLYLLPKNVLQSINNMSILDFYASLTK